MRRIPVRVPRLARPRRPRIAKRYMGHMAMLLLAVAAALGGAKLDSPRSVGGIRMASSPAGRSANSHQLERRPISMLTSREARSRKKAREELVPDSRMPRAQGGSAFDIEHKVAAEETLGDIAKRYNVSVLSIALSNNLAGGKLLAIGETLRIPRISGVPHVIEQSESLESIAAQYNVSLAAIVGYGPNDLVAGEPLPVGREIFIPGGRLPLGSGGPTTRSERELAALKAEPVALVENTAAILHQGPGIKYVPLAELLPGTRLRLLARKGEWLRVEQPELGSGWVAAQALEAPANTLAGLPEAQEIPEYVPQALVPEGQTNLRSGPDIFYDVVGTLSANTHVELVGKHEGWYQVSLSDGTRGWAAADVLRVRPEVAETVPPAEALPEPLAIAVVRDDESNVRRGPDTVYESLTRLGGGTRVRLIAKHEDWFQMLQADGQVGWMAATVLHVPGELATGLPETNDFPAPPPTWVWPTYGDFTSGFGWRGYPWRMFHNGIDIANRQGTPIVAARRGTVIEAGWCSGYGYCVKMSHEGGLVTEYGHMMSRPVVRAGDYVEAGHLIGYMGSTYDRAGGGYSTGPHLHFTVKRNGSAVNPMNYLP